MENAKSCAGLHASKDGVETEQVRSESHSYVFGENNQ